MSVTHFICVKQITGVFDVQLYYVYCLIDPFECKNMQEATYVSHNRIS